MSNIRNRNKKKGEKKLTTSSFVMMGAIIAFFLMAGLLFQHSKINEINMEIRDLQVTLDAAVQANDSKEGQLVTNMDLQAIEAQARGYGMVEPVQEQYRRETVEPVEEQAEQTETEVVIEWLQSLF
jgi:cell division protein FtsL